jgi:hypothetical protein
MPEFVIAVEQITYYAIQAKDEAAAIDLVLEGEGLEISAETRDAYMSAYERYDPRGRHAPRADQAKRLAHRTPRGWMR